MNLPPSSNLPYIAWSSNPQPALATFWSCSQWLFPFRRPSIRFLFRLMKVDIWKYFVFISSDVNQSIHDFWFKNTSSCLSGSFHKLFSLLSNFSSQSVGLFSSAFWTPSIPFQILTFLCVIFSNTSLFHVAAFWVSSFDASTRLPHVSNCPE